MSSRTRKFLSYYRPYLGLFARVMACAVLGAAISLLIPLCARYITKDVLAPGNPNALRQIAWVGAGMLALVALQTACNYYVDYRGHSMGALMEGDLRGELFAHYQELPFRFYDEQRTGQLMSRLTHDLFLLSELYHHGPEDYTIYLVKFVGALVILARINLPLTLVVFLFLPVLAVFSVYFNRLLRVALQEYAQRIGDVNAQVEDSLAGIRVVQSFANEAAEQEKFDRQAQRFLESRKNKYRHEAYVWEGVNAITQLISVAVIVLGGVAIVRATLDLPDLLTFLLYIGSLTEPVQQLTHMTQQLQEGLTGFDRFMEMIEIEPEIRDAAGAVEPEQVRGQIRFEKVAFRYREGSNHVLQGIDLQIEAGEYVALVGSSGAGKTTLCSLIPRFYDVTGGRVCLDGVDVREIKLSALRRSVGVVQQDVYLFAGTVAENIAFGRPGASREEIMAAAKQADAHDFIMALPDGYDTDIGQRGVKLSGGQKQRLSIARVFLKDPPVLIFDEATSALDIESEKVVQEALEALAQHRTALVIAHRRSTIRNARRVLVLSEQGIEEKLNLPFDLPEAPPASRSGS